jgi:hypothetical protein
LQYQKKQVKREVKHRMMESIDKSALVFLRFNKQNIDLQVRWEHSKEFEFKGQMYDIVYTEDEGDYISYWCWHDADETSLNQKLADLVQQQLNADSQQDNRQHKRIDLAKLLYFGQSSPIHFQLFASQLTTSFHYFNHYHHFIFPPNSPPPQIG